MRTSSLPPIDSDELSSPDPLATSELEPNESRISKRNLPSPSTRKQPSSRNATKTISILPPSSPSRTVTEQTLSPWKIKVTVEAEPEEGVEKLAQTVTKTIKVPLREEGSSPKKRNQKSGAPQSRSRSGSTSKEPQRSATPERRRRPSVTDLDIVVLGDDADEEEWGRKIRKNSPAKPKFRKSTSRRKSESIDDSIKDVQFNVRQDTDLEDNGHDTFREDSPELRQIDLNKVSVRNRSNSTKQKTHPSIGQKQGTEQIHPVKQKPYSAPSTRKVSNTSTMTYPTPSPTVSERGDSDEIEKEDHSNEHAEGFDTIMESEGFTMIDLDSIPSVRQILSSPPEDAITKPAVQLASPTKCDGSVRRKTSAPRIAEPAQQSASSLSLYPTIPEDESEISSTLPSSPPMFQPQPRASYQKSPSLHLRVPQHLQNRKVTPQPYASPDLPAPPKPSLPKERNTPDSAKAMRAGLALQGAVQPVSSQLVSSQIQRIVPKETTHVRSSSDEIFEGFDSNMQRELRAGLRFGEELAKRQESNSLLQGERGDGRPTVFPTQVWRGESVISRTPIQTQTQSPGPKDNQFLNNSVVASKDFTSAYKSQILAHRDAEAEPRHEHFLERQAIPQQTQEAVQRKVTANDDDEDNSQRELEYPRLSEQELSEDVTMEDGDIWLEEAKDSSSSPQQSLEIQNDSLTTSGQSDFHQGLEKPRRQLIPSPWKRGEQVTAHDNSTILTNGDEFSGLFWKQPSSQESTAFGNAAIRKVRKEMRNSDDGSFAIRRNSGAFDINKMLGTPKRIRESLEREQQKSQEAVQSDISADTEAAEAVFGEDDADVSHESVYSEDLEQQSELIPVNPNDSNLSQPQTTPPQCSRSRVALSPSAARPPTPRSAMKGSRQSFGAIQHQESGSDQGARKVIFAERSKGVNIDWVESSSSLRSVDDEASSPIVDRQKRQEERQQMSSMISQPEPDDQVLVQGQSRQEQDDVKQVQSGWFGWLTKNKQSESNTEVERPSPIPHNDGAVEPSIHPVPHQPVTDHESSVASSPSTDPSVPKSRPSQRSSNSKSGLKSKPKLPSIPTYLLPPSYPTDPTRSIRTPLGTTGEFTKSHFRTLHILHRKSQRPRFHAPEYASCRPELRALSEQSWQLSIDETEADLGGFVWTVGQLEARVLERFCREVEFSILTQDVTTDLEVQKLVQRLTTSSSDDVDESVECGGSVDGMWSGLVSHGMVGVRWEWNVERLATFLGRIVVGEVVRAEEQQS